MSAVYVTVDHYDAAPAASRPPCQGCTPGSTADALTLEQLTDLVGAASGWHDHANITFRRDVDRSFVPHRCRVAVSVEICGGKATVSAEGRDHRAALIALLQSIETHHREILRWHKQRCERTREILEAHDIYYVKGTL